MVMEIYELVINYEWGINKCIISIIIKKKNDNDIRNVDKPWNKGKIWKIVYRSKCLLYQSNIFFEYDKLCVFIN